MSVCVKSQRQVELCHDGRKQVLNFHSNEREGVVKWRGTFQVMCLSSGGIVMKFCCFRAETSRQGSRLWRPGA